MKDVVGSPLYPSAEAENCLFFRRNRDILIGTLSGLLFHMLYAGHYVCGPRFHIERKGMSSAQILLTLSGEGELRYRDVRYSLKRGDCILIDSREPHEYYPVSEGWAFKYLHFWGGGTEEYLAYLEQNGAPVRLLDEGEFGHAEAILDRIMDGTEEEVIGDYPAISREIYSLITLLMTHDLKITEKQKPDAGPTVLSAVEFIRKNYNRRISTEDIARAVNLSRTNLFGLFQKAYGIPPHEYLTQYRLSVAKNLLTNTSLSVTEIAEQTGFRDIYAFSRVFRQYTGVPPREFRRENR